MSLPDLSIVLLHEGMRNKEGRLVTTSLTLNDIQDLARCAKTYGVRNLFIAHPSPSLQKLARRLLHHWEQGFGSTYNPKRKQALEVVQVVSSLDAAIMQIDMRSGQIPVLVGTSAKQAEDRTTFSDFQALLRKNPARPYLIMLGTGWGMSEALLKRAELTLAPIKGPTPFNHLSVRSAGAIILDRLLSETW